MKTNTDPKLFTVFVQNKSLTSNMETFLRMCAKQQVAHKRSISKPNICTLIFPIFSRMFNDKNFQFQDQTGNERNVGALTTAVLNSV